MPSVPGLDIPVEHYQVLGIAPFACADDVKAAYKQQALLLHPDRNGGQSTDAEFKRLLASYEVLSDFSKKVAYDAKLSILKGGSLGSGRGAGPTTPRSGAGTPRGNGGTPRSRADIDALTREVKEELRAQEQKKELERSRRDREAFKAKVYNNFASSASGGVGSATKKTTATSRYDEEAKWRHDHNRREELRKQYREEHGPASAVGTDGGADATTLPTGAAAERSSGTEYDPTTVPAPPARTSDERRRDSSASVPMLLPSDEQIKHNMTSSELLALATLLGDKLDLVRRIALEKKWE